MSAVANIAAAIVVLALLLIFAQVWDLLRASSSGDQQGASRSRRLAVTCPQTKDPTYIWVNSPAEAAATRLTVLSCDRFPNGTLCCHRECVLSEERSAA